MVDDINDRIEQVEKLSGEKTVQLPFKGNSSNIFKNINCANKYVAN